MEEEEKAEEKNAKFEMLNMKGRQKQSKKSWVGGLDGNEKSIWTYKVSINEG